jgi:hypothetical protein
VSQVRTLRPLFDAEKGARRVFPDPADWTAPMSRKEWANGVPPPVTMQAARRVIAGLAAARPGKILPYVIQRADMT